MRYEMSISASSGQVEDVIYLPFTYPTNISCVLSSLNGWWEDNMNGWAWDLGRLGYAVKSNNSTWHDIVMYFVTIGY